MWLHKHLQGFHGHVAKGKSHLGAVSPWKNKFFNNFWWDIPEGFNSKFCWLLEICRIGKIHFSGQKLAFSLVILGPRNAEIRIAQQELHFVECHWKALPKFLSSGNFQTFQRQNSWTPKCEIALSMEILVLELPGKKLWMKCGVEWFWILCRFRINGEKLKGLHSHCY